MAPRVGRDNMAAVVSFLVLMVACTSVHGAKILMSPFGMFSHVNIHTSQGKALQDAGHEVWVLTLDIFHDHVMDSGLTPLTVHLPPHLNYLDQLAEYASRDIDKWVLNFFSTDYWTTFLQILDLVMEDEVIMKTIGDEKFDLYVQDGSYGHIMYLTIPYKFDLPFITLHGFQLTSWVSGVTGMPSIEPEMDAHLTNRMDFWQRLANLHSWLARYYEVHYELYSDAMAKYSPPHKPRISVKQLVGMSEMYLMNHEVMCLDYPRVSAPNMQYLGGSTASPPQPLPEDLETYITQAEHGVVLMTLGSMKATQRVWPTIAEKIFSAFQRLPQKIIVQYRLDTVHGEVPPNVKLMKWIPQNDILGHPNVKLFVTHGGNNGQNEAIYHGVPMLVIPVGFDQTYDGNRIELRGYGKMVHDKKAVTSEELYDMMREILTNQTYSDKTKKCSAIVRSMPTAQEKFVFWVNHILQFGGAHLRPPSLDMPLYQVLMLDIVAYYVIMALAAFHAAIFLLYFLIKFLCRQFKTKKD